jgi:DNA-binding CsgD family transcriptional regulator
VQPAREAVERITSLAQHQSAPFLRGLAALARGKLCVAEGADDPRSCFHEAMRYFAQARLPVETARTQLELARAMVSSSPAAAAAQATTALESFERLQAERDAKAAWALLRSLGVGTRPGPRDHSTLTRREAEVLDLVGRGLNNAQIAERLFISPKTVEHHVGRILAKLGLPTRARAVAYAAGSRVRS